MTILDQLADYARQRVAAAKVVAPTAEVRRQALELPTGGFPFERALSGENLAFICECKKASPSKGLIAPDFPYLDIARNYEAAGAEAISVLTEPKWFLGQDEYLREIARAVSIPCLRKDFTVDEYMLYQARLLGASAVLLICAILDAVELAHSMSQGRLSPHSLIFVIVHPAIPPASPACPPSASAPRPPAPRPRPCPGRPARRLCPERRSPTRTARYLGSVPAGGGCCRCPR